MTNCETLPASAEPGLLHDRRAEAREPVSIVLWMVDHYGSTVLKCQCIESSPSGMRLRVPLGYGIAEGQRYELRSHLPGSHPVEGFGVIGARWATVVRTQVRLGEDEDHLDVGVLLDATDHTALTLSSPAAALV
jgi:hypothetical protein